MSFSFDGAYASATRPPHTEPAGAPNWAKDPSGVGAKDGTIITASWANEVAANLRALIQGAGVALLAGNHVDADTMVLRAVQAIADSAVAAIAPRQNLLINGDMAINQRVFAGGALGAGVYGYDRWEGDTGGCAVSRAIANTVSTITLTSGTVMQVIEAAMWGSLAGQQVTISIEDLAGGTLNVAVGTQSGAITPGAGRRGATMTLGAGETGNINVKLTPASAAVTFRNVKVEVGAKATAWLPRPRATEMLLCQRYYWKSYAEATAPGTATTAGQLTHVDANTTTSRALFGRPFPVPMRGIPALTGYSPATGAAAKVRNVTGAADVDIASHSNASETWTGQVTTASAGAAGNEWSLHLVAAAEL